MKSFRAPEWLRGLWAGAASLAVDALCPPMCAACLADLENPGWLCDTCQGALPRDALSFCCRCGGAAKGADRHVRQQGCSRPAHSAYRARCLYWMHGPVPLMIHQFKYRGVHTLAEPWGSELGAWLERGASSFQADWLLPMPLHPARERERGYNQSVLLARAAARRAGLPCVEDALRRVRRTPSQTGFDPRARRLNLAGAFEVVQPALVRGARIVLVEDVITTGATVCSATGALIAAGARSVAAVAVARA